MTDVIPPASLTDRAVARLRKLASGNGLEPASIAVIEASENNFTVPGKMDITPLCETESITYPGGVRGRDRKIVATGPALQEAVARHKAEFRETPDWIAATIAQVRAQENQGWGLENAKVTLPEKSATYATTGLCPSCNGQKSLTCVQCQGRGTVICTQCQGQGREQCYYCGGRGEDPQQPGQRCHTCNGTRLAPCRFCQTHGYLPCPTCHGQRGTPCGACQATGKMTQEATVTCGAETHFQITPDGLPSGLRRGLERIGIANLGKGHADITATLAPQEKKDEPAREGAKIPALIYKAILPYAEIRMNLGTKKAVVSALGKRCSLSGVPPFLDAPLQPWRDKLHQAAIGQAPLAEAIEATALRQILSLTIAGKGRAEEVRKLYPYGLSSDVVASLLTDTRLALNKTTLTTRAVIAVLYGALACALFYALFVMGIEIFLTRGLNRWANALVDLLVLAGTLGAGWATLNFSTLLVLRRRFPNMTLALQQKIGKTGLALLAGIVACYILCLSIAPLKPLWLALLLR